MDELYGYHGTKSSNVNDIISDNFKEPVFKKEDNHWLGHGIYFFSDYELAEWWANTKVKIHNTRYKANNEASVIKAKIKADSIIDLDKPHRFNEFVDFCDGFQREIVEEGIVLDFTCKEGWKNSPEKIGKRKRCFFLDNYKANKNIDVLIYTFTKSNPSYASSKYRKSLFEELDLHYNEKQICVSNPSNIYERIELKMDIDSEEVI